MEFKTHKINVLLVDDSTLLLNRLKNSLKNLNCIRAIRTATNTTEALAIFEDFQPEVIVLDISIPYTSGLDVLTRTKGKNPATRVIIFTNFPTDQFKEMCLKMGADYFLDKAKDFFELPVIFQDLTKNLQLNESS